MKKEIVKIGDVGSENKKESYEKNEPPMSNIDAFCLNMTWIIPIFLTYI
ncbi:hypothetical protein [Bacillus safensis]